MTTLALNTIMETYRRPLVVTNPAVETNIFKRLAAHDPTAVPDCVSTYGNAVWAFANKYTNSFPEAEALARAVFQDIWKYAEKKGVDCSSPERDVIRYIAIRRYFKHKWERPAIV